MTRPNDGPMLVADKFSSQQQHGRIERKWICRLSQNYGPMSRISPMMQATIMPCGAEGISKCETETICAILLAVQNAARAARLFPQQIARICGTSLTARLKIARTDTVLFKARNRVSFARSAVKDGTDERRYALKKGFYIMKYTGEILNSGLGSKDRRAALVAAINAAIGDIHGNSENGRFLSTILADAESRLNGRRAAKAAKAESADVETVLVSDVPVSETTTENNPLANPNSKSKSKQKSAKPRKNGGKAAKAAKAAGSVPCMACFKQTPFATATVYTEGYVCPTCEAESNE